MIRYALFDLDQTLYPRGTGIMHHMDRLIERYMIERLDFTEEATRELRPQLWHRYGTTLSGLLHEFGADPMDYLHFIHDVPLDRYIEPNPELDEALARLPMEKVVFSNAMKDHCERVLCHLGIRSHFSHIFDIVRSHFVSKPNLGPYRRLLREMGWEGKDCVMIEDTPANLRAAATLGMATVLVGPDGIDGDEFDFSLARIEEIGDLVPALRC